MPDRPETHGYDPELGPMVAIPVPFWTRPWRRLFRWSPSCFECRITFRSEVEWEVHYLSEHYGRYGDG